MVTDTNDKKTVVAAGSPVAVVGEPVKKRGSTKATRRAQASPSGARGVGAATTSPCPSSTNMSAAAMRSFCTPDGAMTMRPPDARRERPPPVPETQPSR